MKISLIKKVHDPATDAEYAVKKLLCQTDEAYESAQKELEILKATNHENVMKLIASSVMPSANGAKEVYMLLPLYRKGTLQEVIDAQKASNMYLSQRDVISYLLGACQGVRELHNLDPPQCHNDIKPANMMVLSNKSVAIFDFGSANNAIRRITNRQQAMRLQEWADQYCTPIFKAPELFDVQSDVLIDERTDVWALGCTLYALMFNVSPFEEASITGSTALAVLSGKIDVPEDAAKRFTPGLIKLMRSMLAHKSEDRPYLDTVIQELENMSHQN
eukprot:TRINITY_DN8476_c0_g1_i1.p1 TRINITY_DN8476_c0_g1~~TRINITY_DN8476_c0_g1_i1.p1  ORF type:complete len:275 (+),score=82.24 TRINITY_DN8476_c0_g1_i1:177-1001(+)